MRKDAAKESCEQRRMGQMDEWSRKKEKEKKDDTLSGS